MLTLGRNDYEERLWRRVFAIEEHRAAGHLMPILWRLSMIGNIYAQIELARRLTWYEPDESPRNRKLATRWSRRAALRDDCRFSRYHLAIDRLNRGDLTGYRYWLARDKSPDSREELRSFKIRFSHCAMRRWPRFYRKP